MPADDFQKHVAGLAVRRLEKPKNLKEQCQKYWDEILSYQYHFNRGEGGKEVVSKPSELLLLFI